MSTLVRPATVQDAELVGKLLDDFNREYHMHSPGAEVLAERLSEHLEGGTMLALLAGEGDGVALLTFRPSVWYTGPVATLEELYVVPELRNRRIGHSLLLAAEDSLREKGGALLEINVEGDDEAARRFYERHGYRNHEEGTLEPLLYYFRELA